MNDETIVNLSPPKRDGTIYSWVDPFGRVRHGFDPVSDRTNPDLYPRAGIFVTQNVWGAFVLVSTTKRGKRGVRRKRHFGNEYAALVAMVSS